MSNFVLLAILGALLLLVLLTALALVWTLKGCNSKLGVWGKGCLAAFLDGFIETAPVGTPLGGAALAADGEASVSSFVRILVDVAHLLAVPVAAGLSEVRSYQKANPLATIFPPPVIPPAPSAPEKSGLAG